MKLFKFVIRTLPYFLITATLVSTGLAYADSFVGRPQLIYIESSGEVICDAHSKYRLGEKMHSFGVGCTAVYDPRSNTVTSFKSIYPGPDVISRYGYVPFKSDSYGDLLATVVVPPGAKYQYHGDLVLFYSEKVCRFGVTERTVIQNISLHRYVNGKFLQIPFIIDEGPDCSVLASKIEAISLVDNKILLQRISFSSNENWRWPVASFGVSVLQVTEDGVKELKTSGGLYPRGGDTKYFHQVLKAALHYARIQNDELLNFPSKVTDVYQKLTDRFWFVSSHAKILDLKTNQLYEISTSLLELYGKGKLWYERVSYNPLDSDLIVVEGNFIDGDLPNRRFDTYRIVQKDGKLDLIPNNSYELRSVFRTAPIGLTTSGELVLLK